MNASDPRFDVFYDFEEYLRQIFPALYVFTLTKLTGQSQGDEV